MLEHAAVSFWLGAAFLLDVLTIAAGCEAMSVDPSIRPDRDLIVLESDDEDKGDGY